MTSKEFRNEMRSALWGQRVICKGCGRKFRETVRRPCETCGSLNRMLGRWVAEGVEPTDVIGVRPT